jgi:hypothetical protein
MMGGESGDEHWRKRGVGETTVPPVARERGVGPMAAAMVAEA